MLFFALGCAACAFHPPPVPVDPSRRADRQPPPPTFVAEEDALLERVRKAVPESAEWLAIADLPLENGQPCRLGSYLAEVLATDLAAHGARVVERSRLDLVMAELRLQLSDLVQEETRQRLGEHLGVDHLLLGAVTVLPRWVELNLRFVHLESGVVSGSVRHRLHRTAEVVRLLQPAVGEGPPLEAAGRARASLFRALETLAATLGPGGDEPPRVVVHNLTYQGMGIAGPLALFLRDEVRGALHRGWVLSEFPRADFDRTLSARGASLDDLLTGEVRIADLDAVLTGSYWVVEEAIELHLDLHLPGAGAVHHAAASLPRAAAPAGLDAVPANLPTIREVRDAFAAPDVATDWTPEELRVDLWVDRGAGGIYHVGDTLVVSVVASRECYLELWHTSAEGVLKRIFPNDFDSDNRFHARREHRIGGPGYPFAFELTPPCGGELLTAIAQTAPFPSPVRRGTDRGIAGPFLSLGQAGHRLVGEVLTRGVDVVPRRARAQIAYSILPRRDR